MSVPLADPATDDPSPARVADPGRIATAARPSPAPPAARETQRLYRSEHAHECVPTMDAIAPLAM